MSTSSRRKFVAPKTIRACKLRNIVAILKRARKTISKREAWTTGHLGRDAFGTPIDFQNEVRSRACSACAIGHVYLASDNENKVSTAVGCLTRAIPKEAIHTKYVGSYNDNEASHEMIVQLFDKAIELAESEGKI